MLNLNGSSLFFERIKFLYDKMNNKKKQKTKKNNLKIHKMNVNSPFTFFKKT